MRHAVSAAHMAARGSHSCLWGFGDGAVSGTRLSFGHRTVIMAGPRKGDQGRPPGVLRVGISDP